MRSIYVNILFQFERGVLEIVEELLHRATGILILSKETKFKGVLKEKFLYKKLVEQRGMITLLFERIHFSQAKFQFFHQKKPFQPG